MTSSLRPKRRPPAVPPARGGVRVAAAAGWGRPRRREGAAAPPPRAPRPRPRPHAPAEADRLEPHGRCTAGRPRRAPDDAARLEADGRIAWSVAQGEPASAGRRTSKPGSSRRSMQASLVLARASCLPRDTSSRHRMPLHSGHGNLQEGRRSTHSRLLPRPSHADDRSALSSRRSSAACARSRTRASSTRPCSRLARSPRRSALSSCVPPSWLRSTSPSSDRQRLLLRAHDPEARLATRTPAQGRRRRLTIS